MSVWQRGVYVLLVGAGCLLAVRFGLFWFDGDRLPRDAGGHVTWYGITLFVVLSFVVWQRQIVDTLTWFLCAFVRRRSDDDSPLPKGFRVAFVTTFVPAAEPIDMLRATLVAMIAADYEHDTWVLDEGGDPFVERVCVELGARYFTRAGRAEYNTDGGRYAVKTKGGNHNAWYDAHAAEYDFVAQIDTDFITSPDYLVKMLAPFNDDEVAFVGSPQIYGNTATSLIARGAAEQTYLFYGPIMRAFGDVGSGLLIGANHVVRVAALADVGGYVAHITEDLATGMQLHSRRWKSRYIPEPMLIGEGPTDWRGYFNQQYRWAFGCLDILFRRTPRLMRTMKLRAAVAYPMMQTFYFNGLSMMLGVALLLVYFTAGLSSASMTIAGVVSMYVPLLLWRQAINLYLQRMSVRPELESGILWAGRLLTVAAMPIYFLALVGAVRGKRMHFKVTPKGTKSRAGGLDLTQFRPHLAVAAVSAVGVSVGLATGRGAPVMVGWGVVTVLAMASGPVMCEAVTMVGTVVARLSGFARLVRLPVWGARPAVGFAFAGEIAPASTTFGEHTIDLGLLTREPVAAAEVGATRREA